MSARRPSSGRPVDRLVSKWLRGRRGAEHPGNQEDSRRCAWSGALRRTAAQDRSGWSDPTAVLRWHAPTERSGDRIARRRRPRPRRLGRSQRSTRRPPDLGQDRIGPAESEMMPPTGARVCARMSGNAIRRRSVIRLVRARSPPGNASHMGVRPWGATGDAAGGMILRALSKGTALDFLGGPVTPPAGASQLPRA
jgi:hypothetical protein